METVASFVSAMQRIQYNNYIKPRTLSHLASALAAFLEKRSKSTGLGSGRLHTGRCVLFLGLALASDDCLRCKALEGLPSVATPLYR